jgi:hypothetical protein
VKPLLVAPTISGALLFHTDESRAVAFTARIIRSQTYGGDVSAGVGAVLIFGLQNPEALTGVKFGGQDVNISLGLSLKGVAKAPQYWKLIEAVNAIRSGSRVSVKVIEGAWTAVKGSYWSGTAMMSRGSNVLVTLIDLPTSMGAGVSYVVYDGVITHAAAM